MPQVQFSLLDHLLMHLVAMGSCSISPVGHRPFIQPEGLDNGLDRTPIRQECHNDHDQFDGFAQPLKHRSPTDTERLFTDPTAIALALAIMDRELAPTSFASCRTPRIRPTSTQPVHPP